GARRLRRDEEVALPRGLARSGRLRHPARAPRFHGEHRDVRGRDPGRLAVIGNANRQPTTPELAHMAALVDTLMQQGALGVWTALEYAPASYSTTNEIIALARAARRHGGIYASHMRN